LIFASHTNKQDTKLLSNSPLQPTWR